MEHDEDNALGFLRGCTTTQDLLDRIRGCYGHLVPDCAAGLCGYLMGYGQAAKLAHGNFNREMQRHVERFLGIDGERWTTLIERYARQRSSEIPLVYAAADFGQEIIYENAWSSKVPEVSRVVWDREQCRALKDEGLPAPIRLVLAQTRAGSWRLFFLDENDIRFNEISMSSREGLADWARSAFHLDSGQWIEEASGAFNRPPAELNC